MRTRIRQLFRVALSLVLASPGFALERSSARLDDDRTDAWAASATSTIRYYNICTGWTWVWSGFEPSDRFGVVYQSWGPFGDWLETSWHCFARGAPAGYGFTGTVAVSAADLLGCPSGVPLQSQPFLPVSGWNPYFWRNLILRHDHVVHITLGPAPGTPLSVYTDHPAPGPTGPQACGTCYPMTRVSHSYYYGPPTYCPPSPFFDGFCDAELLWECETMINIVDVESVSWGAIKNLYR